MIERLKLFFVFFSDISSKFGICIICLLATSCASHFPLSKSVYIGAEIPGTVKPLTPTTSTLTAEISTTPHIIPTTGALELTLTDAILLGLENNQALKVQRFNPDIRRTAEDIARAAFDPNFMAQISRTRQNTSVKDSPPGTDPKTSQGQNNFSVGISEFLPTGTNLNLNLSTNRTETTNAGITTDENMSNASLSVTQSLLRGFGLNVNLASLRQARLDTRISEYELRGYAETLVAQIEEAYLNYLLAQQKIKIYSDSLKLAEEQLKEIEERIRLGKLAGTELYAAQAEVALRREALINAKSTLQTTRLQLLRLLNPPGPTPLQREIVLLTKPFIPDLQLEDVETHIALAMKMRPDLNEARLELQRGELEVVKTRNGLLPQLDLFIRLGRTGYADSFENSATDATRDSQSYTIGVNFEYPLLNRAARARYKRSIYNLDQMREALLNQQQLAEVDVRSAYIEILRLKEQVAATAATRKLQEESFRAENEKFRLGKSTSILVAAAQRDLLSSQINEVQAVVNYLKAIINFYRLEGTLLERHGIIAPGREPIQLNFDR
ncbi:MAG: TolC family protein [Candidatus Sumerlaeia bacterium]|nr:TolC family protein [Candidatus Sumerlaeia bacterium]